MVLGKAFEFVDYQILIEKLFVYGMHGRIMDWLTRL